MRHIGNNTNFQRLLKLVFTLFSTKNIMDTIEEGILNALVCSAPNLQKLEIRHFGNKPFNYIQVIPPAICPQEPKIIGDSAGYPPSRDYEYH